MRILPALLAPWRDVVERRHQPPNVRGRYGYRAYRPCLRWEFGFTCPFCLCHEADLAPRGAEGLGVTQVEHFVPVSQAESGANVYANCFYVCIYCNHARSSLPTVDLKGRRLLDPCRVVWAENFDLVADQIEPRNEDAAYTCDAYNLNDRRKTEMRRYRRETIDECLDLLARGRPILARLFEKATQTHDRGLVEEARIVEDAMRRAWRDLESFEVVPLDATNSCACGVEGLCTVPKVLEEQTLVVEPLFGASDHPKA